MLQLLIFAKCLDVSHADMLLFAWRFFLKSEKSVPQLLLHWISSYALFSDPLNSGGHLCEQGKDQIIIKTRFSKLSSEIVWLVAAARRRVLVPAP